MGRFPLPDRALDHLFRCTKKQFSGLPTTVESSRMSWLSNSAALSLDPGTIDRSPGVGICDCVVKDAGETFRPHRVVALELSEAKD